MPATPVVPRGLVVLASFGITLWLLSWLKPVLVPIALAILFTFLLTPLVAWLQRKRLARVPAVVVVVAITFCVLSGIGWLIARQVTALVDTYPQYERNLSAKLDILQGSEGGFIDKLQVLQERISQQIQRKKHAAAAAPAEGDRPRDPLPVTVIPDSSPFQLSQVWSVLGPAMEPFAALGLTIVLLLFMLIRREDLRDRAISLIGRGHLTLTTKAMDEAGDRISRYLLTQLSINASFGVGIAAGLFVIGVPYALLWGFLATVLRYIPYLGAWLAALLPVGLAVLVSQTWTMPLLVLGWFLMLEFGINMVIEPMLYGRGIGVSETATLVMVAFWAWLWGPVGLVLATPLTVCLVVLGKYVPALGFFDTLLGNRPAIEPSIGYYQRLLARDQDEASEIATDHFEEHSLVKTFDGLLIPALIRARRDVERGALPEADQQFIIAAVTENVEDLVSTKPRGGSAVQPAVAAAPAHSIRIRVLLLAARNASDEAALRMLKEALDPTGYDVSVGSAALLASEAARLVGETRPDVVCIAAVPPGGVAQARLLCLRLSAAYPEVKLLVGRWGATGEVDKARDQLAAAGAHAVGLTLESTLAELAVLRALGGSVSTAIGVEASEAREHRGSVAQADAV
ncbi:MAG: AI-2E family transporter [Pseudomonadota bacterium]|nr:AI-2E family transporter [Pseudomonadota bacterium]